MSNRTAALLLTISAAAGASPAGAADLAEYLRQTGRPPREYLLEKTARYRLVILGEGHWIRHDNELVRDLVPALADAGVTLAMEVLPAREQDAIDRLLAGDAWDPEVALSLLRRASWPYREPLEIMEAAWRANQGRERKLRILAVGPPADWRQSLAARGISNDEFMAERVAGVLETGGRVLLYVGHHHAFTAYHQPELDLSGRAMRYMDRTGNILRRRYGEQVFLVGLHRPLWCGQTEPWGYCLPLDGAIDCAATQAGRAVGFDVPGSPVAESPLGRDSYYARSYPSLRFVDFTDGWIWTQPIEGYRLVTLIPLDEIAPDDASLAEVIAFDPFTDEEVTPQRLREIWQEQARRALDPMASRGWTGLLDWRASCPR